MDQGPKAPPPSSVRPFATALAVEDEAVLRLMIDLALVRAGGRVHLASSAEAALAFWAEHRDEIDVLITDIVLPGPVDGIELIRRLRAERPGLAVILTTGSGGDRIPKTGLGGARPAVLIKPYELDALVAAVQQAMAARPEA